MSSIRESSGFELPPWHEAAWHALVRAWQGQRLPHALLLTGLPGIGKELLALNLAHFLLCREPRKEGRPCGRCRGCHLVQVGTHPDLRIMEPDAEAKSRDIKVDAVRELTEVDALCAQAGGYKITVILPAEQMNRNAANSLLKTLEEPGRGSLLILVSARPAQLLPTIRSRCQQFYLRPPAESEALGWLARRCAPGAETLLALRLSGGAPLAALTLLEGDALHRRREMLDVLRDTGGGQGDPVAIAQAWMKQDQALLLEWFGSWVADILRLQSGHPEPRLSNPDRRAELAHQAARIPGAHLHRFWRQLTMARAQVRTNLNPQFMLEALLAQWTALGAK